MLIELPLGWVVGLNVAGWPILQLSLAWIFTRLPATWFADPPPPRSWEQTGRVYERLLAIKRWKDRLPDGASWFAGGFAKSRLAAKGPDYFRSYAQETWRGELCHWWALAAAPVFFLWNPWWADLILLTYALAANLPCIFVQRYNRARLQKLLARAP